MGLCYSNATHVEKAIQKYAEAATVFGNHPELALEIGKGLYHTGQIPASRSYFEIAIHDDKTRSVAHVYLSKVYSSIERFDLAMHHLQTAIQMAPAWLDLLPQLAMIQSQCGNERESRQSMDTFHR